MNQTTRKFPRTSREAFGLSAQDAVAMHVYKTPLIRRMFFGLVRYSALIVVVGLIAIVLSGCSDALDEDAQAQNLSESIEQAKIEAGKP